MVETTDGTGQGHRSFNVKASLAPDDNQPQDNHTQENQPQGQATKPQSIQPQSHPTTGSPTIEFQPFPL